MAPAAKRRRRNVEGPPPIEDQIEHLTDNMLMCRDLRHAWGVEAGYHKVEVEGGIRGAKYLERRLACLRCDTLRVELVRIHSSWIERISTYYVYPEGYHLKGAKRGDNVQGMVRWVQMRRSMEAAG